MQVRPLDILLAFKAFHLVPGLKSHDRTVAAALLDHFNQKSGQCDPGLERIADLLNISARTVIRSVARIERVGLFVRRRHGGHFNRNSYEPNWRRFQEIEAAWKARKRANSQSSRAKMVSPATCQTGHLGDDRPVTQTYLDNQSKETCQKRSPKKPEDRATEFRSKRHQHGTFQKPLDAARNAAERRWTSALHEQFASQPVSYGEIIQAIDQAMQAAATDAEVQSRGAGLAYIVNQLKLADPR
jgi:predicted transcriptional regulator